MKGQINLNYYKLTGYNYNIWLPKLRVASSNLVFRSFRPLHPMDAAVSVYNGYELAH